MGRGPRIEIENGFFHVTCRAVYEQRAFLTARDRFDLLFLLARAVRAYGWLVLAYCLMGTHFHLVVQTPRPTLSAGMQLLNGMYARRFNARHGRRGHLFEDRFRSGSLNDEAHLLSAIRYAELNPVRAGYCSMPAGWRWSSFRALAGLAAAPAFLAADATFRLFAEDRTTARRLYREFVEAGLDRGV